MKRLVGLLLVLVLLLSLCACGNMSMGPGNFNYEHAYIGVGYDTFCVTVEKWYDYELGVELKTKEFGGIFCAEGTYVLIEDATHCPYCKGE